MIPETKALHSADLSTVPVTKLKEHLEDAPYNNLQREKLLHRWFEASGCQAIAEQLVTAGQPPNLMCNLKGESRSLIIVGGHTDHVRKGWGVVDDWSGASMLPLLFRALNTQPREHSLIFIGFAEEEKGLVGSAFFVRHVPVATRAIIRAMINLECLGLAPPEVWSDHADPLLLSGLLSVATRLGIWVRGVDVENIGRDDAESFRQAGMRTITIHSLTQANFRIMHSPEDAFSAIDLADYDESFKLIAAYLAYLDTALQ